MVDRPDFKRGQDPLPDTQIVQVRRSRFPIGPGGVLANADRVTRVQIPTPNIEPRINLNTVKIGGPISRTIERENQVMPFPIVDRVIRPINIGIA